MAYKLSFGDGDADAAFWERLSGYCGEELGLSTLRVRSWDADLDCPTGEPFDLGLTGDEEVHVY